MKNRIFILLSTALLIAILLTACGGNQSSGIINTAEPVENGVPSIISTETEVFAANYFLGIPENPPEDYSSLLQEILNTAAESGGTVYITGGTYTFSSPIHVPDNVKIKGNFSSPSNKTQSDSQTILIITNTDANKAEPFITLGNNSEISGLKIYYENQDYLNIQSYPFTISADEAQNAKIENITISNCYSGVSLRNSADASLKNIYITAYDYGISAINATGFLTLKSVNVSPIYYLNDTTFSSTTNFDSSQFRESLLTSTTGISISGAETVSIYDCSIDTANIGLYINIDSSSEGTVSTAKLNTVNCQTALYTENAGRNGIIFESSTFGASGLSGSRSVYLGEKYETEATFSNCFFTGFPDVAIKSEGSGLTEVLNGSFSGWHQRAIESTDEVEAYLFSYFGISNSLGILENYSVGLFVDCVFQTNTIIEGGNYIENSEKSDYSIPIPDLSTLHFTDSYSPTNEKYVKASDFGVTEESDDIGPSLQQAIDSAAENGAAIVFLEPGKYRIKTAVKLRDNIFLIGAGDNSSATFSTEIISDQNSVLNGSPIIEMANGSGISDIAISFENYTDAEQTADNSVVPNSFAIIAENVSKIKISNINLKNAPNSIRLTNVGGGYIENIRGSALYRDMFVEESSDVIVSDCRFSANDLFSETYRAFRKENGRGIEIFDGDKIKTLNTLTSDASSAITLGSSREEASETAKIISVAAYGLNVSRTILAENTENALFIIPISSPDNGYHYVSETSMNGVVSIFGIITKGNTVSSVLQNSGTASIYGGIFKKAGELVVQTEGGILNLFGNIFPEIPSEYHISASGGEVVAVGNIVRSETMFSALNATYMKTSTDSGTVTETFSIKGYESSEESNDESSPASDG